MDEEVKLAIFDIDGTLTNTNSVDDECFVGALAEAHAITGINTDWASYQHTTDSGITMQVFQERLGRDPEAAELDKFKSCFVRMLRERYKANSSSFAAMAGAAVMLNRLKAEPDWAVAIATGSWRESALLKLKAAQLDVDGIPAAFAEDGLSREAILLSAVSQSLQHYRLDNFAKTVSIGDGLWDVRAAQVLRFSFLGVGRGDSAVKLTRAGAKHVIEGFGDYDRVVSLLYDAEIPG